MDSVNPFAIIGMKTKFIAIPACRKKVTLLTKLLVVRDF